MKSTVLEYSTEIGLMIEEDFAPEEKKLLDTKIVLDAFNEQLRILKVFVEKEDQVLFKSASIQSS